MESALLVKRDLETADRIAKVTLSTIICVFYLAGFIQGPASHSLVIISAAIILAFILRKTIVRNH